MPMGTIVQLTRDKEPIKNIGCMNNLYASVENLDVNYFRTRECQLMLLRPRNGAATQCNELKLKIDSNSPYTQTCIFGNWGPSFCQLNNYAVFDPRKRGVFVKGQTRLLLSDKLQVIPPSTAASFALLSNFGVKDSSKVEDGTYDIGEYKVLNLLKSSMVSDAPLTETLLKKNETSELSRGNFHRWSSSFNHQLGEEEHRKIGIKLLVSKSKNIVCCAEVGDDFVDLLFSFLTVPLGCIIKKMRGASSDGCLNRLYKSIEDLDVENYFKSNVEKEILLSPKIEEVTSNEGFVVGPVMFTVTDDLIVTIISPISALSVLDKLNVPFSDIEERIVQLGTQEALCLLVASFTSESALTDTFILRKRKTRMFLRKTFFDWNREDVLHLFWHCNTNLHNFAPSILLY